MINSTFFKFLVAFATIVCTSFLIMAIAGDFDAKYKADQAAKAVIKIDLK